MAEALTVDLLAWISKQPRTYEETLDAWKTHCPRLSIWDDAVIAGLVRIACDPERGALVTLTDSGRAVLAAANRPAA